MNHEFWYLSRAAGFTAYLLLFVSVALGIMTSTRVTARARRNLVFDLHRFTTILALGFSLFHVYILLGDSFFQFSIWSLSLPFLSPYRDWQTAVGVFGLYALAILIASFYLRRFTGYRTWRALHFTTFAMFAAVALHGITAGSDTSTAWARLMYISTIAIVVGLIVYRVQHQLPEIPTVRATRFTAAIATVFVALLLVFATGLMSPGGQAQGGEPNTASNGTSGSGATGAAQYPFLPAFQDDLNGTYSQTSDATHMNLVIDAGMTGDVGGNLHVEVVQATVVPTPDDESIETGPDDETAEAQPRVVVTKNTAQFADPITSVVLCSGTLQALNNGSMRIACDGSGPYAGTTMLLTSQIAARNGALQGTLDGTMRRTT